MKNKLLAKRYAKALISNLDESEYEDVLNDIKLLFQIFKVNVNLIDTIDSTIYPLKKRIALSSLITENLNKSKIWKNLFTLLVNKKRFFIIFELFTEIEYFILDEQNKVKVNLKIAHKQSKDTLQEISKTIKNIIQKEIILNIQISPEIIGGFVAKTQTLAIDGSVKNNLVKLMNITKI